MHETDGNGERSPAQRWQMLDQLADPAAVEMFGLMFDKFEQLSHVVAAVVEGTVSKAEFNAGLQELEHRNVSRDTFDETMSAMLDRIVTRDDIEMVLARTLPGVVSGLKQDIATHVTAEIMTVIREQRATARARGEGSDRRRSPAAEHKRTAADQADRSPKQSIVRRLSPYGIVALLAVGVHAINADESGSHAAHSSATATHRSTPAPIASVGTPQHTEAIHASPVTPEITVAPIIHPPARSNRVQTQTPDQHAHHVSHSKPDLVAASTPHTQEIPARGAPKASAAKLAAAPVATPVRAHATVVPALVSADRTPHAAIRSAAPATESAVASAKPTSHAKANDNADSAGDHGIDKDNGAIAVISTHGELHKLAALRRAAAISRGRRVLKKTAAASKPEANMHFSGGASLVPPADATASRRQQAIARGKRVSARQHAARSAALRKNKAAESDTASHGHRKTRARHKAARHIHAAAR